MVEMCAHNTLQAAKQMSEVCVQGILETKLKSCGISFVLQMIGEGQKERAVNDQWTYLLQSFVYLQ